MLAQTNNSMMRANLRLTVLPVFFVILVLTILNITHSIHEEKPPAPIKRYDMFSLELVKQMRKQERERAFLNRKFNSEQEEGIGYYRNPHNIQLLLNSTHDDLAMILFVKTHVDLPFTSIKNISSTSSFPKLSSTVDKILNGRSNGFFLEYSTTTVMNTKFFEEKRGWTGLLVEADPEVYGELQEERRRAYVYNGCLSPSNFSEALTLFENSTVQQPITVQCFPVYTFLRALNITHIDYFSMTSEGSELQILQTIPFGEVRVDVFSVNYMNPTLSETGLDQVTKFFKMLGNYEMAGVPDGGEAIFVRKGIAH